MYIVEDEPLTSLLNASGEDTCHHLFPCGEKQTTLTFVDEVEELILLSLFKYMVAAGVFFLLEMNF